MIFITLLAWAFVVHAPVARAQAPQVWGYVVNWLPEGWRTAPLDRMDRVVLMQWDVTAEGSLTPPADWPQRWGDLLQASRSSRSGGLDAGIAVFDVQVFNAVFASAQATRNLLDAISGLAAHEGLRGVHLDVEVLLQGASLLPQNLARFRSFVADLRRRLLQMQPKRHLSAFLPAGAWGLPFDAPTVAALDHLVLQGYDAHFAEAQTAGPVSPLRGMDVVNWEKMVAQARALKVPAHRQVMGFPLYGYEWPVPSCNPRGATSGKGVVTTLLPVPAEQLPNLRVNAVERVQRHGAQVEPVSDSLHYRFTDEGGMCRVGWFEDSWSLGVKADWLRQQGLAGMAFFPLGYDQGVLVRLIAERWQR